jgi:predicted ATPase
LSRFVIISGCSSGGKSTLIAELARRGHATVPEPGRRVVRDEQANGGSALPWADTAAFVDRIVALARADYRAAYANPGWTFFDRGLFDAISALGQVTGTGIRPELLAAYPYHRQVFLTPPWPEIYETDGERKHGLAQAEQEYDRLLAEYPAHGYEIVLLPKVSIPARADFVERKLLGTIGADVDQTGPGNYLTETRNL